MTFGLRHGRLLIMIMSLVVMGGCLNGANKQKMVRRTSHSGNDAIANKTLSEKNVVIQLPNQPFQKAGFDLKKAAVEVEYQGVSQSGTLEMGASDSTITVGHLPIANSGAIFVRFKEGDAVKMTGVIEQVSVDGNSDQSVTLKDCGIHEAWTGQEMQGTCSWQLGGE